MPTTPAPAAPPRSYTCPKPDCGWTGDFDAAFVAWCRSCGHGADPSPADADAELSDRARDRLAREAQANSARALALFEELKAGADPRPHARTRRAVAVFSVAVHIPFVLMVAGVVTWVATTPGNPVAWFLGALGLVIAMVVRPRVGRAPRGRGWLRRAQLPALFGVLDKVADAVGAQAPDAVAFNARVNASTARSGLRQRQVMILGVPLWTVLSGDQRVALLGRELAHQVNGDSTNTVLAASAQSSLDEWAVLLNPRGWRGTGGGGGDEVGFVMQVAAFLVPVMLLPFYLTFLGLRRLHERVWFATKPRAEYLADRLAAKAAGTDATARLTDTLVLVGVVDNFVSRQAARRGKVDLWDELRAYADAVPDHERERLRLLDERSGASVDSSHPPTYLRRRLLLETPAEPGSLRISDAEWAAVDAELAPLLKAMERDLLLG
ncbi:M48 family metalloprotease [Yinghuangia seranimata]|uniref:M48 family metalloprotease n=1 Tax=Yinghuangia seranimata TaxID=408067 RepID=UPI00248BE371|nr:M48 family metalloprotease [Yinghuangia seranimata]MDI2131464.1 M48 family metalloprotease [Yinghuangia seranimata]